MRQCKLLIHIDDNSSILLLEPYLDVVGYINGYSEHKEASNLTLKRQI